MRRSQFRRHRFNYKKRKEKKFAFIQPSIRCRSRSSSFFSSQCLFFSEFNRNKKKAIQILSYEGKGRRQNQFICIHCVHCPRCISSIVSPYFWFLRDTDTHTSVSILRWVKFKFSECFTLTKSWVSVELYSFLFWIVSFAFVQRLNIAFQFIRRCHCIQ